MLWRDVLVLSGTIFHVFGLILPRHRVNVSMPGDVIIGGLVPFHMGHVCQHSVEPVGVEIAETIAFTVRQVNKRSDLLPNVTIGFDIRDTCDEEDVALLSVLSLLRSYPSCDSVFADLTESWGRSRSAAGTLVGIVGTLHSSTSLAASRPTNICRVPMISHSATSDVFSDKSRFPFFLRTVPPDKFQARTIIDILAHFNWHYVGLIYSLNNYGIYGTKELMSLAESSRICTAFSVGVRENASPSEIQDIVQKITEFPLARVLVMFGNLEEMQRGLKWFFDLYPDEKRTLVCSDAFSEGLDKFRFARMIQGSIAVRLNFQKIPGILEYLEDVCEQSEPSLWFDAFRDEEKACPLPFAGIWMPVYQSVYAFAVALDDMLRDLCPEPTVECVLDFTGRVTGKRLLPYLRNVTFEGPSGEFQFDSNGETAGAYVIATTVANSEGRVEFKDIGRWDWRPTHGTSLSIEEASIAWPEVDLKPPVSICQKECQKGYVEVLRKDKCCWDCRQCAPNEMVETNKCVECPILSWPSKDFMSCESLVPTTVSLRHPVIMVLFVICGLGVLLAMASLFGMIYYRGNPLIKATGREVSLVALSGTILAYLTIIPMSSYPTRVTCGLSEAMLSTCFSLTYAPTLLKVNRIWRIFQAGLKSAKRPPLVRPRHQILLVLLLLSIQALIMVIFGLTNDTSRPAIRMPNKQLDYLEIYCKFGNGFIASCAYNSTLILACCYYAYMTRSVPSNYNESRYIGVSVYSTLVLCAAAVPIYTLPGTALRKVAIMCLVVSLNAYLTLACSYLPKLYAARFVRDVTILKCTGAIADGNASTRIHPMSATGASGAL